MKTQTTAVASLRNLGPRTVQMLAQVGIHTPADLRRTGAVAAYAALRRAAAGVTMNALYALQGALQDVDWREVRRDQKLPLLLAVEDHERGHPSRTAPAAGRRDELLVLRNLQRIPGIGPEMAANLADLDIRRFADLGRRRPERMYRGLADCAVSRSPGALYHVCVSFPLQVVLAGFEQRA
jgi:DNA transformation protein